MSLISKLVYLQQTETPVNYKGKELHLSNVIPWEKRVLGEYEAENRIMAMFELPVKNFRGLV